ncbi:hypothetical protein BGZ46_006899 [Entomortierella lignicola]|nr:hypothetical protein BGZ46_006899 [Entomortierella lignicola]
MIPSNSYVRNTMPASFQPGEQPFDIVAPTPRPPHSPSWLNPSEVLEGSLQSKPNTITVDDEQDLPPLRFGRGERPDADDEPESEDELMPRRGRSVAYQEPTPNLSKPTSPTFLKQLQAVSLQDNSQTFTAHNTKPEIQTKVSVHHNSPQSETHSSAATHHGEHQYRYHQQPQQTPPQLPISTSKPISPTRLTDINSGDIPFGAGNSPDQFGVFSPPRQ